jgi:hypothetical protein
MRERGKTGAGGAIGVQEAIPWWGEAEAAQGRWLPLLRCLTDEEENRIGGSCGIHLRRGNIF